MQRILHALQCRGSQPPQSRVQFALRLERALHTVTKKISLATKIRQRRLFLRRRMPRRSRSLHQLIKIHARSQRPHRPVRGRTVKIILHPHRWRRIQKQNPNLRGAILSGKLHTLGAALYVRFVRTRAATFTNGHAISSDSAWTRWESMARRTKTGNTVTTRAVLVATLFITRSSASPRDQLGASISRAQTGLRRQIQNVRLRQSMRAHLAMPRQKMLLCPPSPAAHKIVV